MIIMDDDLMKKVAKNPSLYVFMERTGVCKWTPRSWYDSDYAFIDQEIWINDVEDRVVLDPSHELIWMESPAEDLRAAELAGHPFGMPDTEMARSILLFFGTTRLESDTHVFEYGVPGTWNKIAK
jgi:hypothetical protein